MSKKNDSLDLILLFIAGQGLTKREYKVLLAWLYDRHDFHASQRLIARRTGVDQRDVQKVLRSLTKKGLLAPIGKTGCGVTRYALGPAVRTAVKRLSATGVTAPQPSKVTALLPSIPNNQISNIGRSPTPVLPQPVLVPPLSPPAVDENLADLIAAQQTDFEMARIQLASGGKRK